MPRLDTNRAAEMEVFVRVVDLGGFTAAAREFRLTPSGVSKLVSRLESRLGSRLVNRSTRKLQLTPEGRAFYLRATRMAVVASPDYLARHGTPATPPELASHRGIGWTFLRTLDGWPFRGAGQLRGGIQTLCAPPVVRASDGEAARKLALGGVGIAR